MLKTYDELACHGHVTRVMSVQTVGLQRRTAAFERREVLLNTERGRSAKRRRAAILLR